MVNRETWLNQLTKEVKPLFEEHGYYVPSNIRVTCGWCSTGNASQKRAKRIGECFSASASNDATIEIIISMAIDNPMDVASILVHELVHAVVGNDKGHGKIFRECALKVGLTGKMTATVLSETLEERLKPIVADLGNYPHATLNMYETRKKQATRMLKVKCPTCAYQVRLTRKWLDVGAPNCPVHNELMQEA
tara:strand:+ start:334 stop:909 length:576 start_codon:yes stop_codon:yes gene_type:complete